MNESVKKIYDGLPVEQQKIVQLWRRTPTAKTLYEFAQANGVFSPSEDLVYLEAQYGKGWV